MGGTDSRIAAANSSRGRRVNRLASGIYLRRRHAASHIRGQSTRAHTMGLDTPELYPHSKCANEKERGYAACDHLRELMAVAGSVAFCPDSQGRYGRTLAVVMVDGRDVAELLIGEGLAPDYLGGRLEGWCEQ